jgi:hypothetical protein
MYTKQFLPDHMYHLPHIEGTLMFESIVDDVNNSWHSHLCEWATNANNNK